MAKTVDIHPVANIFPMMTDEELKGLAADIKENGLREDVVFWRGQLIDGRNRIKACEMAGVEWSGHGLELDDDIDPVAYVVSHNLHRRHLTSTQRAMVGDRIREYFDEQAEERQLATLKRGAEKPVVVILPQRGTKARDAAGAAVGVSGSLVDAARTVRREGSPELIALVEADEVSVTKAAKIAKTKPKAEQAQAAKEKKPRKPKAKAKPKAEPQPEQDESPQYVGVFQRLREVFDLMSPDERNAASSMWQHWIEEADPCTA